MKKALLFCLIQWSVLTASGQYLPVRNSFRVGMNMMTLGGIDAIGLHYQARYARHLASDRLLLALSAGYFQRNNRESIASDLYADSDQKQRLTTDFSVLVDLLPSSRSALRIGGGLSYWYRSDKLITARNYSWSTTSGYYDFQTSWSDEKEWNLGYHLTLEYETRLSPQLALNGQIGWANFTRDRLRRNGGIFSGNTIPVFQSAQAGLGLSYLF
ncbi:MULTISPECIES: hypothetical protein [unclassified Spirosoma]|uniref:hypothetical protein n=1 Tax=unclassified Spirosoma TaxID=2621999 RepID=UPI00095C6E0D|nr:MULTISPECIES: hypothetical protein [unclassified Spirosoma]MBN8825530.1 hypothetical protein [Spirosoma sp.]OJW74218.1 MAG: hypothetical protein BGO59_13970 [Spirosoma sp. 48-14]